MAIDKLPTVFSDENKSTKAAKAAEEKQVNELYAEIGQIVNTLRRLCNK